MEYLPKIYFKAGQKIYDVNPTINDEMPNLNGEDLEEFKKIFCRELQDDFWNLCSNRVDYLKDMRVIKSSAYLIYILFQL